VLNMKIEELLKKLKEAIINGDIASAEEVTRELVRMKVDVKRILEESLVPAMDVVGKLFEEGEYFIPELMLSAEAFKTSFEILKDLLPKSEVKAKATIVIGTVRGDIHELGKNLVATMLRAAGFEVIDLGVDVSPEKFIEAVKKHNAQVLGLSALMTTTMIEQKKVIEALMKENLKKKVKVIVGGAPVTEEWAKQIGADAYGKDAYDAVRKVKELLNIE